MSEQPNSPISFRKKALEHVERPARLDEALQVVSIKNWVFLALIFVVLFAFFIWLIFGKIFIRVPGKGVLISQTGNAIVVQGPTETGKIETIPIQVGQFVKKNTVLMTFSNDLSAQLKLQEAYLKKLKDQKETLSNRSKEEISKIESNQYEQIAKTNESLIAAKEKLKQLSIMLELKEQALKKGIIDLPNVTETRIQYYNLLQEIRSHEADLIVKKASFIELKDKWNERVRDLLTAIYRQEYDYGILKKKWDDTRQITSPVDGVIAEVSGSIGEQTKNGESLITIIPVNPDLYALAFVPATQGKLIHPGMSVQVTPSIVNKLEYGSIIGIVESDSPIAITKANMMGLLKNENLLNFFETKEPLIAIKIKLKKSKETISGYQWTSSSGPDLKLTQGTLADVIFNVKAKRPIALFLHSAE